MSLIEDLLSEQDSITFASSGLVAEHRTNEARFFSYVKNHVCLEGGFAYSSDEMLRVHLKRSPVVANAALLGYEIRQCFNYAEAWAEVGDQLSLDWWGPVFWNYIHTSSLLIAYAYPRLQYLPEKQTLLLKTFSKFVYDLDQLMPSATCKAHFIQKKTTHKQYFVALALGLCVTMPFLLHNVVSLHIGKKAYSELDFVARYHCALNLSVFRNNVKVHVIDETDSRLYVDELYFCTPRWFVLVRLFRTCTLSPLDWSTTFETSGTLLRRCIETDTALFANAL